MAGQTPTTKFNDLYDSTNRRVLGFITAKCGSLADISDIFQETYLVGLERVLPGIRLHHRRGCLYGEGL